MSSRVLSEDACLFCNKHLRFLKQYVHLKYTKTCIEIMCVRARVGTGCDAAWAPCCWTGHAFFRLWDSAAAAFMALHHHKPHTQPVCFYNICTHTPPRVCTIIIHNDDRTKTHKNTIEQARAHTHTPPSSSLYNITDFTTFSRLILWIIVGFLCFIFCKWRKKLKFVLKLNP